MQTMLTNAKRVSILSIYFSELCKYWEHINMIMMSILRKYLNMLVAYIDEHSSDCSKLNYCCINMDHNLK